MRVWTVQAPEVVATVRSTGVYRATWDRVSPSLRPPFEALVAEMTRRGIDCGSTPPVWCWPGRGLRRSVVRRKANALLSLHEWAHGRWLLILDVPADRTLTTSYSLWNDYLAYHLGSDGPSEMDWTCRTVDKWDQPQVTVPELRQDWILRARPYPPDADIAARIEADPILRARARAADLGGGH
ncbi:hypothetical protein [Nocardia sp. NPDC049149]|uniref:hypothetical protein n=1 Tax=Nocardia sp. NPDC049149 TaxID=3364315 RepID=UPI003719E43E